MYLFDQVDIICYFLHNLNCDFRFALRHTERFLKRVNSKRKEFAPTGSKFFPFRVDPFSEGRRTILIVGSTESVSISPLYELIHRCFIILFMSSFLYHFLLLAFYKCIYYRSKMKFSVYGTKTVVLYLSYNFHI